MPEGRRIIFNTYVRPIYTIEMEEAAIEHAEFQASPNGTLGGGGTVTLDPTQWGDQWTSTTHGTINKWEEFDSVNWEDLLIYPSKSGRVSLTVTPAQLTSDSTACEFLYIKNLGTTNKVLVALDETGLAGGGSTDGNYYIIIPPGGSVHLRGDSSYLSCSEVYVKSNSSTTELEYLIAEIA